MGVTLFAADPICGLLCDAAGATGPDAWSRASQHDCVRSPRLHEGH